METSGGWEDRGACRGADPALFFPERGQTTTEAKAVCATCPVRQQCLAAHLHEPEGVWGGTTPGQRRRIRVELGATQARAGRPPAACGTDAGYQRHRRDGEQPCDECREAHTRAEAGRRAAA